MSDGCNPQIGLRITAKEKTTIQNIVASGHFMSVSDFVRQAIREKLEEYKNE